MYYLKWIIEIKEYIDAQNHNPHARRFKRLNARGGAQDLWREYKQRRRLET